MQGWRYRTQDPNSFQPEGEQIMKLTIDQKFISIGNKTAVVDETGKQWFRCQGKLFRFNPNFCISSLPFSSVQPLSCVQHFATPWSAAHQASLSITNFQSLRKLMSIESVMPSDSSSVVPFSSCLQSESVAVA